LPDGESKIFFESGLDDPNQLEMLHETTFLAHAILWDFLYFSERTHDQKSK
jgi:hypothetical protein